MSSSLSLWVDGLALDAAAATVGKMANRIVEEDDAAGIACVVMSHSTAMLSVTTVDALQVCEPGRSRNSVEPVSYYVEDMSSLEHGRGTISRPLA